jgi:hypothetical protein
MKHRWALIEPSWASCELTPDKFVPLDTDVTIRSASTSRVPEHHEHCGSHGTLADALVLIQDVAR